MKRSLTMMAVLAAAVSLAGCTGPEEKTDEDPSAKSVEMSSPSDEWQKHACTDGARNDKAEIYQPTVCRGLDKAANALEVDTSSATISEFRSIWRKVYAPYFALTGREATLRLVPGDAMKGTPAMTCPGPTPTVYFSKDVIDETLEQNKYNPNFLAFIAGHELAHRLNDYSCEGASTSFGGNSREALADLRGAFFTTVAGFSTRDLAEDKTVDRFLEVEAKVRGEARKERREALKEALANYGLYEGIYQTGLTMSLSHAEELASAARVVGWADELMTIEAVPVPEFKLLRALILMRSAIPNAPWNDGIGELTRSASALRCSPVMGTHTALQADIEPGGTLMGSRGKGIDERIRAVKNLELALEWADSAEKDFGANPLIASNLRGCIQFYLGEPGEALDEYEDAMKAAKTMTELPKVVKDALAANRALFEVAKYVGENKWPSDASKLAPWRTAFGKFTAELPVDRSLEHVIAEAMGKNPKASQATASKADASAAAILADAGLLETDPTNDLGTCPEGTEREGMVPAKKSADKSGTNYGVTFCRPKADGRVSMISRVRLSESLEPEYEQVQLDVLLVTPPTDATVKNLLARCPTLERRALSPDGAQVYAGSCDGEDDVVVYTHDEKVQRIHVLRRAEEG